LEELLPIKYERMAASPFTFFRGAAAVMAADLERTQVSGIEAMLCGDAHLGNFGVYASPERKLVFDLNDFDEGCHGPWEWDLKRLATSAVIASRERGFSEGTAQEIAQFTGKVYREAMHRFARQSSLEVWHYQVEVEALLKLLSRYSTEAARNTRKAVARTRRKPRGALLNKITEVVDGRRRLVSSPPHTVRLDDLAASDSEREVMERLIEEAWMGYQESLPEERRMLLSRFRPSDAARRIGGIGSVGTRCFVALLEGASGEDAVIVQQKEAGRSALERHLPPGMGRTYANPAERVVTAQRLIQATSDIFLGWHHGRGANRYFYWRQVSDMQVEVEVEQLSERGMRAYLASCGMCLARAHARTGYPSAIAGYLGSGEGFDRALGEFAVGYADQTERDHGALAAAVKAGDMGRSA